MPKVCKDDLKILKVYIIMGSFGPVLFKADGWGFMAVFNFNFNRSTFQKCLNIISTVYINIGSFGTFVCKMQNISEFFIVLFIIFLNPSTYELYRVIYVDRVLKLKVFQFAVFSET